MSTFSYSTIGIGNRDVTQITTTIGLATRLEIGDWAHVDSPEKSDVIIVDTRKAQTVVDRFGTSHVVVTLGDEGSVAADSALHLERPAGYSALINLFRSLESRVLMQRNQNVETPDHVQVKQESGSTSASLDTSAIPNPLIMPRNPDHQRPPPPVQSALSSPTIETPVPEITGIPALSATAESLRANAQRGESASPEDSMADLELTELDTTALHDTTEKRERSPDTTATDIAHQAETASLDVEEAEKPSVNLTLIHGGKHVAMPVEPPSLDKVVRPARRFYPASRILGMIRAVISNGTSAEISHPDYPSLSLFPVSEWFQFERALDECPALFRVSAAELFFREISSQKKPRSTQEWAPRPLWALTYTAAYYGSEGRLMQHCSPWDQLQLLQTPDFALLPHEDEHPLLAQYLLDHQADIETIAKDTGIALTSIINFTNACHEARLLRRIPQPEKGGTGTTPHQPQEKAPRYRVFSWFKKPFSRS